MDEQGQTIRDRITILRRMAPKRDGFHLYRTQEERKKPTRAATLFVYIRSDDNTYALHETFFRKKRAMTPVEWQHFMRSLVIEGTGEDTGTPAEALGVLRGAILPGVNIRSQKLWDIRAVIGFITHDLHGAVRSALASKRHKTKSQRKSDGQTNIRRRHRNSKRKAK